MGVLAVTLAITTLLSFQLRMLTGREGLATTLERERGRLQRALPAIARQVESPGAPVASTLRGAAERYFELNPGTETYLTVIHLGDGSLTAEVGPRPIERLIERGEVPPDGSGGVETVETTEGRILTSSGAVATDAGPIEVQVLAPLEPVRREAVAALLRVGAASLVSLVIGALVLTVMLRRALKPLGDLAATARHSDLEQLSLRVPEPRRADEVGILATEVNHMLERLETAVTEQRRLMASVSHELRTPVTIARGHIEVLERLGADDEDRRRIVELVRDELARVTRLVDDLMTLARSTAADFLVPGTVSLRDLMEDLELRTKGFGLGSIVFHPCPDATFTADADRLSQAALNLIVNAHVHTPADTPIEVEAAYDAAAVSLAVRDHGRGIDPEVAATAFEPFVSGAGAPRRSTGLGLAVVRAVVDAHHGSVDVRTGDGGTSVTLRIPNAG